MAILVQADEKDVMEMMEDASIDMKKRHRNPFLKAWKAEKAAAEAKAALVSAKAHFHRSESANFHLLPSDDIYSTTNQSSYYVFYM
jgi:hypothetical protein